MINKLSSEWPQNTGSYGCKWDDLVSFRLIQPIFFNDLRGIQLAPKAEVTGSNPVGCAIFSIT